MLATVASRAPSSSPRRSTPSSGADDPERRRDGLRRFKRRELLRIASRDLLGFAPLEDDRPRALGARRGLPRRPRSRALDPPVPFAVIGMGRLGGAELSYASDIDVLFVYDGDAAADFDDAEHVAELLVQEIGETHRRGPDVPRSTPAAARRRQGSAGPFARRVPHYYERYGLTWERQALSKARFVAGVGRARRALLRARRPVRLRRRPFTDDDAREVRRMKARIERERIPPGEDPQFHLKLGKGSLSDVEFTVQLLQLLHGARAPRAARRRRRSRRSTGCESAGLLDPDDAAALEGAYRFCERARNALYLQTARPSDSLPTNSTDAAKLGLLLDYVVSPASALRDDYRRVTRRARRVVEHVFYGLEPS